MKAPFRQVLLKGLDHQLGPFGQTAPQPPSRGWLRAVRESVGLTQATVAKKLGITPQAYAQLESAEQRGAITLASLQRAAEALGCELTYWVKPRPEFGPTFADLALFHDPKQRHLAATEHSMSLEG
jgi:predicted DNA-binding mobile mystery protein A